MSACGSAATRELLLDARFRAAIFDLDGVLIDSEPLWREAERGVFRTVGIELSDAMCRQTMGWRIPAVVDHWQQQIGFYTKRPAQVVDEILAEVASLMRARGCALPGVPGALDALRARGLRLGLASSSPMVIIDTAMATLGIRDRFETLQTALDQPQGKPHPDVYIAAARALDVAPELCLAFEDSVPGIRSARAAGMTVIAVPAREDSLNASFEEAALRVDSLEQVVEALSTSPGG